MAVDIIARGLSASEIARQKRLRILNTLRAAMGRTGLQPLELAATLPTIAAGSATTAIATGTTWQVSTSGSLPLHAAKYTFTAAKWINPGASYPNTEFYRAEAAHQGNGADPSVSPIYNGRVRFALDAPQFEIYVSCGPIGVANGIRVKCDGKYVKVGVIGTDATNGAWRFFLVTWGDGSAAYRKVRHYELEFTGSVAFIGVRTANLYRPSPWPQPDGLRVLIHGDSMVGTVIDTADKDAFLFPPQGLLLGDLLGQSDCWVSGTGGAGWATPTIHNQSWFNDRVALDVVANAPDVIVEMGGVNDAGNSVPQATEQALVRTWLDSVIGARPETIVFMTGPMTAGTLNAATTAIQNAKAAAAAAYPRNVGFIDTLADPWFYGTGKQGAATGDGNRDWAIGNDGAHPTLEGHRYLAGRIARAVAGAIPGLIAAQA